MSLYFFGYSSVSDVFFYFFFFFFKQKTAYEMRISDWSSDVCSSDLHRDKGIGGAVTDMNDHRDREHGSGRQIGLDEQQPERDAERCGAVDQERPEIGRASCRERVCQYV